VLQMTLLSGMGVDSWDGLKERYMGSWTLGLYTTVGRPIAPGEEDPKRGESLIKPPGRKGEEGVEAMEGGELSQKKEGKGRGSLKKGKTKADITIESGR